LVFFLFLLSPTSHLASVVCCPCIWILYVISFIVEV
jgi:hypothetical protein